MTDIIVTAEDVIVTVQQPVVPASSPPVKVGLVEINQIVQRGSIWSTGVGPPTLSGGQVGDMYLDTDTGDIYLWNGTAWEYQGTFAPSTLTAAEILALLITVDGPGSLLDADTLDGHDSTYFATKSALDANTAHDGVQDGQIAANTGDILNISNEIADIDTALSPAELLAAIKTVDGPGSGLDADTLDGHDTSYFGTASADATHDTRLTAVELKNTQQDAAIALRLTDAPADTNAYARKGAAWVDATEEAPSDGLGYMRKNGAWAPSSGGASTDDLPPPGPLQDGQLWWKSSTGVFYIWYDDGNSQQWVQVSASPQLVDQNYSRKTARARNRVNNPTAQISQELGTAGTTTSGGYPADQWALFFNGIVSGALKGTVAGGTPEGTTSVVAFYATTAKPTLAATDYLQLYLPIEGYDIADFNWGTPAALPAVLRFAANASAPGTYGFSLGNYNADQSFCGSFTLTAANQWQVFSFAIPPALAGTWKTDFSLGAAVRFLHAAGSNFVGVAGWQAGNKLSGPGCSNGAAVANTVLRITDVGLHLDPEATGLAPPFSPPPYEDDLARCLRYWETATTIDARYGAAGVGINVMTPYGTKKRTTPTLSNTGSSANLNTATINAIGNQGLYFTANVTAAGSGVLNYNWTANARMI